MKSMHSGFVLFLVLIFLHIFSLIGCYGLSAAANSLKVNEDVWERNKYLLVTNKILSDQEKNLLNDEPTCLIPLMSSSQLSKMPITWWQMYACQGTGSLPYYYVIEDLGPDPCAIMSKDNLWIANYYQISLFVILKKWHGTKLLLQSTVAKPNRQSSICSSKIHWVKLGRQMMRELY